MISGPVGTPYWMSPEVATGRGSRVSWPSDIWSLAITAMDLADGHPSHFDLTPQEAMRQIADSDPPTFDQPARWSADFRDFLACCLQRDVERRPKVATERLSKVADRDQALADCTALTGRLSPGVDFSREQELTERFLLGDRGDHDPRRGARGSSMLPSRPSPLPSG